MHGRSRCKTNVLDAWDGLDRCQRLLMKADHLFIGVIASFGYANARPHDVFGSESGIAGEQRIQGMPEGTHGRDQQDAQAKLRHNQRCSDKTAAPR
jgi:hypothetical protein